MSKKNELTDLDQIVLKALIMKIKSGEGRPADFANAIKYLAMNNINNVSQDIKELAASIADLPDYDKE